MSVEFNRSMEISGEVLAEVFGDGELNLYEIKIGSFQSGLEQGYSFIHVGRVELRFYIALAKTGDCIVVYKCRGKFNILDGLRYEVENFPINEVYGVVEYIRREIKKN